MSPEVEQEYNYLLAWINKIEAEYNNTKINQIITFYYLFGYRSAKILPKRVIRPDGTIQLAGSYKQIGRSVFENTMMDIKSWFFKEVLKKLNIRYTDTSVTRTTL